MLTVPEPSTTLNTAPSVWRQALPSKPACRRYMKVAMVGIGEPPVAGFT